MISEQTALPTRTLTPFSADEAGFITTRSAALRKQVGSVASGVLRTTKALLRAITVYGNPPYFQLERRGPVQEWLGPRVCRESDSFWPMSQW